MKDFSKIRISLASPEKIREWSYGEVKKPETINYRTLAPEMEGLFCEAIFGPVKDWECACGKYKKIRYKGLVCERCGVEVTKSKVRRERMGHIELAVPVAHIWYSKGIPNNMAIILGIASRELEMVLYYARYIVVEASDSGLNERDIITEKEYRSNVDKFGNSFKAGMGAETVLQCLKKLNLLELEEALKKELVGCESIQKKKKIVKRLKVIKNFLQSGNLPEWMILKVLPVLPADLRPMVQLDGGRFATSDLNDLYRRVINRNRRLKKLQDMNAPDIILRNEKRMLQEAVDALIDNSRRDKPVVTQNNRELKSLSDVLKGKQGRFRQNLLGKRVDYSGRSVIVVGPELKLNQCGLPKKMALELYKPFIIKELVRRGIAFNIKAAKRMLDNGEESVYRVTEDVIKGHPVLLNRAPTLHKLSIQAFEPVLIEGKAIRLHPLVCMAFNADFDGDQMAVHLLLSPESISEAKVLMMSTNNILGPSDGRPVIIPSREMLMGCFYVTSIKRGAKGEGKAFSCIEEAILAYENECIAMHAVIKVRIDGHIIETTVGRILLNAIIPKELRDYNKAFIQSDFKIMITKMYGMYGFERTAEIVDSIKDFGFKYATLAGISICVDDLVIPEEKEGIIKKATKEVFEIEQDYKTGKLIKEERYRKITDVWDNASNELTEKLLDKFDDFNHVYMMSKSGARGGVSQLKQLSGMRGLIADTQGKIMETPIKSNFREGLSVLEFFMSSHGARKGSADRALRTADSGYLTRRLVDIAHDVIVNKEDCGNKEGNIVTRLVSNKGVELKGLAERIFGRYLCKDVVKDGKIIAAAGTYITRDKALDIEREGIESLNLRSPMTCELKAGICKKCYGQDLSTQKEVLIGEAVGVIAAQSIGEPGTQLTMRTFHTGGIAEKRKVDSYINSPCEGHLLYSKDMRFVVREKTNERIVVSYNSKVKIKENEYYLPVGSILAVEDGLHIKKGDLIAEIDPYSAQVISEEDGIIKYFDMCVKENIDRRYNVKETVTLKSINYINEIPRVGIIDENTGEILAEYNIPYGSFLMITEGAKIEKGEVIAKILRDVEESKDITAGLPRIQELFETRTPKIRAILAEINGEVEILEKRKKGMRVLIIKSLDKPEDVVKEYLIPSGERLLVKTGDIIEKGSKLTEGVAHINDILSISGTFAAQRYIVDSVIEIYKDHGIEINDKHIEIIVRQMFKKIRVIDGGDSLYLEGEVLDKDKIESENELLAERGKRLITYENVVQGITKASIDTNSFLSAASFQETTKVLANAAIRGVYDNLEGLKENIIIGRRIPAGTGLYAMSDKERNLSLFPSTPSNITLG